MASAEARLQTLQAQHPHLSSLFLLRVLEAFDGHAGRAAAYLSACHADGDEVLANLPTDKDRSTKPAVVTAPSSHDLAAHSTPWCVRTRNGCVVCNAGRQVTASVRRFLRQLHGRQRNFLRAAELDRVSTVNFLVTIAGLNPNFKSFAHSRATPLIIACECGNTAVARCLTDELDADLGARDRAGCTALVYAARNGHERIVSLLADAYVDRCDKGDDSQMQARQRDLEEGLVEAARFGHSGCVALLVEAGATTARFQEVEFAAECGLAAIVKDLHAAGARVRAHNLPAVRRCVRIGGDGWMVGWLDGWPCCICVMCV